MTTIYIILAMVLTTLLFLNIKSAAIAVCRIAGGFALLLIYNSLAQFISLPAVGINIVSSALCGFLELPGLGVLICCRLFL